jgi:DNA-binding SARP family transcriptional activator
MERWQAGAAPGRARGIGSLSAAALLLAAIALVAPARPASADVDAYATDANEVTGNVDAFDGPDFQAPADGRIRGYGFGFTVAKAGPVQRFERAGSWWHAAQGQVLVGFNLRIDSPSQDSDHPVHGAVVADGGRIPIGDSAFDLQRGEWAYVASVPSGSKEVALELSAGGYAQSFSLLQRSRTGPQPAVLYRDPLSPDVVRDNGGEATVRVSDARSGDKGSLTFSLRRARLSFFTPPEPVGPADDPAKAFLVVEAEVDSPYTREAQFEPYKALPPSALTATLPDGTVVPAQHAGPDDKGFMSGSYYFEVPGDVEAARVTVAPGTLDALRDGEQGAQPTPVKAEGAAVFDVEFTPGGAAKLPKLAKGQRGAATTIGSADDPLLGDEPAASPRQARKSGGSPLLPVLVLAVLGGGAWLALRYRRRGPAQPPGPPAPVVDAPAGAVISTSAPETSDATVVVEPLAGVMAEAATRPGSRVVVLGRETRAAVPDLEALDAVRVAADEASLVAEVEAAALGAAREADGEASSHSRPLLVVVTPPAMASSVSDRLATSLNGAAESVDLRVVEAPPFVLPAPESEASAPAGPPIELRLLGPYRVMAHGREVGGGFRGKARELLAFLAVNREGLSTEAIIEALLGDLDPKRAEDQFSTNVSNARSVLRTAAGLPNDAMPIEKIGPRYRLDPSLVAVDVWVVDDADPLEVPLGGLLSDEDFTWAEPASERLRRTLLSRLRGAAEAALAGGALERAVDVHDRIIEIDPYAESSYRELVRLQRQLGRIGDAHRTEQALAARRRELGLPLD